MSKIAFEVREMYDDIVELEVEATKLTPDFVLTQRARIKALRAYGLENIPEEFVEDISEGDLSRFTEILFEDRVESTGAFKTMRYDVRVNR